LDAIQKSDPFTVFGMQGKFGRYKKIGRDSHGRYEQKDKKEAARHLSASVCEKQVDESHQKTEIERRENDGGFQDPVFE